MPFSRSVQHDISRFQASVLNNQFPHKPRLLSPGSMDDQLSRLQEEVNEIKEAVAHSKKIQQHPEQEIVTLVDVTDGIIDLMYFAAGWLHQMGIPFDQAWELIHKANMKKVAGRTARGQDNDAAKPADWVDPKLALRAMILELRK